MTNKNKSIYHRIKALSNDEILYPGNENILSSRLRTLKLLRYSKL